MKTYKQLQERIKKNQDNKLKEETEETVRGIEYNLEERLERGKKVEDTTNLTPYRQLEKWEVAEHLVLLQSSPKWSGVKKECEQAGWNVEFVEEKVGTERYIILLKVSAKKNGLKET